MSPSKVPLQVGLAESVIRGHLEIYSDPLGSTRETSAIQLMPVILVVSLLPLKQNGSIVLCNLDVARQPVA